MSNAAEKVTPIRHDEETGHGSMHEEVMSKTSKDMGKAALFIAILAVLLMVIFFFGIQQNITGITSEMKALAETKTDVLLLKKQMGGVEGQIGVVNAKMAQLEKLPLQAKRMVLASEIQEMANKASYLSGQMDSADQSAKLQQAMDLLNQVQVEVAR